MIYTLTLNPAIDRELTVPSIEFDRVLRASSTLVDFGGKGFNVSRMLTNLGLSSTAIGFLGGRAGELLQDGLLSLGIAGNFVWVPGETRTNISIVSGQSGHYIKVNEMGPHIQPDQQHELLDKLDALACPGDWWVLAGSLPPNVPADYYARMIRLLNKHHARVILDTSGEALLLGCRQKPFLVKPNADEARALTGLPVETDGEIVIAARYIQSLGPENVVISTGKSGAIFFSNREVWMARSPVVEEKNPIGAGDSMVGGLVWALWQGLSLSEALAWGVASGAATASLGGTEVGSRALVEKLYQQVCCKNLGKTSPL